MVLLLDLDQTIVHTTNKDVDPSLEGVHHFQLGNENANSCWHHTSLRSGLYPFLDALYSKFEMHIVTFGIHEYAHAIAKIIDPEKRYFSDRILSREEIVDKYRKTDNLL